MHRPLALVCVALASACGEGRPDAVVDAAPEQARVDASHSKDAGHLDGAAELGDAAAPVDATPVDARPEDAARDAQAPEDAGRFSPAPCGACDRSVGSVPACDASKTVVWACFRALDPEAYQLLRAHCDELYTAITRFCCPPDFAPECSRDGG